MVSIGAGSSLGDGFWLQWYSDGNVYFNPRNGSSSNSNYSPAYTSEWIFLCGVYDGTQLNNSDRSKIYVNGIEVTETESGIIPSSLTASNSFRIGDIPIGETWKSKGIIDEVMIFNRPLSQAEITAIYTDQPVVSTTDWEINGSNLYYNGGNVGIGTTNPPAEFKLAVAGKILSEEVQVKLAANWPDYVFGENYKLRSLQEVATFIEENNHLPEMPNAEEVAAEGIGLGEMDAKLLQKIEELTLYLIEVNKEVKSLKDENTELKQRINKLEK